MKRPFVLIFFLALSTPALGQPRIVCWTDDRGQRACGDVVPPQYAARERQVLNERAIVTQTQKREPTPAEREALAAEQLRMQQAKDEAAKAAAYDRFLLQTYRDTDELAGQRDRRLADLKSQRGFAQKSADENRKAVDDLSARVDAMRSEDKPVPPKLQEQLKQFRSQQIEHDSALASLERQISDMSERYQRDIERYIELRQTPAGELRPISP